MVKGGAPHAKQQSSWATSRDVAEKGAQKVVVVKVLLSLWSMAPRRNGVKHASLYRQSLLAVPVSQKQLLVHHK